MGKSIESDLKNIEKAIVRLRNKIKRVDLDYTVQVSISSVDPTVIMYAAQTTSPAKGLAPITFIEKSPEVLVQKIKAFTKNTDYDAVEEAYHKAQIEACKRTIMGHEERLAEMEDEKSKPKEENKEEDASNE